MWGNSTTSVPLSSDIDATPEGAEEFGLIPVAAQGGSVRDLAADPTAWRTAGDAALALEDGGLTIRGRDELAPIIYTEEPIRDVNMRRHASLTATVRPSELLGTDAPVRFRFRLVHDASRSNRPHGRSRRNREGSGGSSPALSSKTFSVPQGQAMRLHWDLRSVDDRVLDHASRLELVCERADRPASRGPYGRDADGVRGSVSVADVVLSDSPDALAAARLQNHWQRLATAHGAHTDTAVEVRNDDAESGAFVFEDGEVAYDFGIEADGTHVFELEGVGYRFRDGMAAVERK
jgi:hypothetical protein